MNAPERSSAFLLDEEIGEQKVTYSQDTKVRVVPRQHDDACVKYMLADTTSHTTKESSQHGCHR
jgi:hypothetical protein